MSEKERGEASTNILEEISKVAREFRKQISRSKSPRIEKYLAQVSVSGREILFTNLLEIELRYRQSKGESPSTSEYLNRFPDFGNQVRRAFFEPTMGSIDSASSASHEEVDEPSRFTDQDGESLAPTYELTNVNRLGDYELIRELGRGGMGIVYEAKHTKTHNRVALKTLPAGGDGHQVNADKLYRFRKEFRRLSEINHPNLVGMQSLEVDGDRWFFTMDLIDGEDFLSFVRADDRLDAKRLRSCLKQLVVGVMELHRLGIIHRDLKPSNVLVTNNGLLTILDFGWLLSYREPRMSLKTKSGMFAGTPRYAAPEQMFGERTEASDWYAFGTMIYEALSGVPPFHGSDQLELLRKKQEQDPPEILDHDGLSDDLAALANDLVRRDPTDRPTADDICERLGLRNETGTIGSTKGSQSSTGSIEDDDAELVDLSVSEVVLIGREQQLAQLETIKDEFFENRDPRAVWITGLSGEGKSTLVERFLGPLRRNDSAVILSGRCYDRESVPYKAIDSIADSLARFLRSRPTAEVKSLLPSDIEISAHLFPVLRRVKAISNRPKRNLTGLDQKQICHLAFAALGDLLVAIGQANPFVIFVDDLQWGDLDSAEVIRKIFARAEPPALLLLGCYRSDEMDSSPFLQGWHAHDQMETGSSELLVQTINVEPLSESQCKEFVYSRLEHSDDRLKSIVSDLYASSRGNPYFLEQLIEGYDAEDGTFTAVPLEQIVSRRLSRCPGEAAALLDVVAIAGKAVSLSEIARVAGQDQSVISTITHMRSERLLRLVESNTEQLVDTYHDKIRETAIGRLKHEQREKLHLQYAEVLESEYLGEHDDRRSEYLFDLAHHFLQAEDARAFKYQLAASESAIESYAMETALEHAQLATRIQPDDLSPQTEYRLKLANARALAGCNRLDEALDAYQQTLTLAKEPTARASCLFGAFEIYWRRSEYSEADRKFRQSFAELGERIPRSLIGKLFAIMVSLFTLHLLPAKASRRLARKSQEELQLLSRWYVLQAFMVSQRDICLLFLLSVRACIVGRHVSDRDIRSEAFCAYAWLMRLCGVIWPSNRFMKKTVASIQDVPDDERPGVFNYHLAFWHYCRGELDKAFPLLELAFAQLRRVDDYRVCMPPHILWHLFAVDGRSTHLLEYSTKEEEIGRRTNDRMIIAFSWFGQAEGLAKQGYYQQAHRLASDSVKTVESVKAITIGVACVQKTRVEIQTGDYESARASAWAAVCDIPKLRFYEISAGAYALYAESFLETSWMTPNPKLRWPIRLRAGFYAWIARRIGQLFPNLRPPASRVSARLAFAKGKHKKAERLFDDAIASSRKVGARYELARTYVDKSVIDSPDSAREKAIGLALLESLGCVLPEAEVKTLEIDRDAHHARAAMAREESIDNDRPLEFDIEAWESEVSRVAWNGNHD